jgi:hypothetical protein
MGKAKTRQESQTSRAWYASAIEHGDGVTQSKKGAGSSMPASSFPSSVLHGLARAKIRIQIQGPIVVTAYKPKVRPGRRFRRGQSILRFVQPGVETPIADRDLIPFLRRLRADGYRLTDPSLHNFGYYCGQTRLLDPFAVEKLPDGR